MITNWQSIIPASLLGLRQSYVTVPAFTEAVSWAGASEVIKQWEYSASSDLTLELATPQAGYVLCVKWQIADVVYRYKLWDDTNLVLPGVALYNGETINSTFRLEVWSINGTTAIEVQDDLVILTGLRSLPTDIRDITVYEECVGEEKEVNPISGGDIITFPANGLLDVWLNRLEDIEIFLPDQVLSWRSNNAADNFLVGGIVSKVTDGVQFDDWAEELHVGASNDIDSALVSILCRIDTASGTRDNIILRNTVGVCNVDISLSYFQLFPDDGTTSPKIQLPFITGEFVIITMARSSASNPFSSRFGYLQIYRVSTGEIFDATIPAWVDDPVRIFAVGDLINSEAPKMTIGAVARYDETYVGNNYTSSQFRALVDPIVNAMLKDPNTFPIVYE